MRTDQQQIIDLEIRFWQSMKDKDASAARAMIAGECLVTGPMGTMRVDPEKFAQLTREGRWQLDAFDLRDVDVSFPTENVGVIVYKVHETGTMKGEPMDMKAADSTVWVRDGDSWKVALHTETILRPERQPEPA